MAISTTDASRPEAVAAPEPAVVRNAAQEDGRRQRRYNWRNKLGFNNSDTAESSGRNSMSDLEDAKKRPARWGMGIMNDAHTDEVPGMFAPALRPELALNSSRLCPPTFKVCQAQRATWSAACSSKDLYLFPAVSISDALKIEHYATTDATDPRKEEDSEWRHCPRATT